MLGHKAESGVTPQIVCIADRFQRAAMEMASHPAAEQAHMTIESHTLLEDGD